MGRLKKAYTKEEIDILLKTIEGRKTFLEIVIREEGTLKGWSTKRWIKEAKKFKLQCKEFIIHGDLTNIKKYGK